MISGNTIIRARDTAAPPHSIGESDTTDKHTDDEERKRVACKAAINVRHHIKNTSKNSSVINECGEREK